MDVPELASMDVVVVVVVPFRVTDPQASKRRALVLSSATFSTATRHSVLAMITRAEQSSWSDDVAVSDLEAAGLPLPCLVRLKLFTLDYRLILKRIGRLGTEDSDALASDWRTLVFA